MKKIYIIAGEASGDLYGANLIKNLKKESRESLEIYGVGGDRIRETGALEFFDLAHFHVTGLTEVLRNIPRYKNAERVILSGIQKTRPDAVVLIDNPGFNLHLAKKIRALGIPIIYYISPQIWAWAPKRILKIKETVTKMLVVFEFEKKIYEEQNVPVAWVGHPLKDLVASVGARSPRPGGGTPPLQQKTGPLVTLLPGSRKGEVRILLPIFLKAAEIIKEKIPQASFALIKSPTLPKRFYERIINNVGARFIAPPRLVEENPYEAIKASDLAIACSGTVTLECALLGTPLIISNKGSVLTYVMAKLLCKVPYLGLPNLVLGDGKIPELLQHAATPEKIAAKAAEILSSANARESMKKDLAEVSRRLGEPGANRRAALEVLSIMRGA